ncbi:MAG: hypothetical protein NTX50_05885 [Candidatus Sumerlaeota bacterium]|nr:hypothetical protein [Candidatus Sumerlaeota bacterium]
MSFLSAFFGRKKSIKDLSLNDLQTEKVRLEENERRVNKNIEKLEGDKGKLFKQGASEASKRQKIIIARKIKELDEQVKEQDRKSSMLSKQIRVVNRLVSMKRKEGELKAAGLWSTISKMDATELESMLTDGKVSSELETAKVKQILDILETETEMSETLEEDADTMRLVELMEQAGESGQIEEKLAEAQEVLKKRETDEETEQ